MKYRDSLCQTVDLSVAEAFSAETGHRGKVSALVFARVNKICKHMTQLSVLRDARRLQSTSCEAAQRKAVVN